MTVASRAGLPAFLAALATACADLSSTRDVRVTVMDEDSRPVPGAVFYVEAVDAGGAFAWRWARTGSAGEVPDSAREPLKLPWRRGARVAMAAFAPGRRPAVLRETGSPVVSDGAVLILVPGPAWDAELAELAYPFEPGTALAESLARPQNGPLRAAFRDAWATSPSDVPPALAERRDRILAAP